MRAVWVPEIQEQNDHVLTGEALHHLLNVARIESGEEVLLLSGRGLVIKCQIMAINKKEVHLKQLEAKNLQRPYDIDLAIGVPKREALELALKEATELGLRRVYLVRSDRSQIKVPEPERLNRVLVSALEQSNAPFLPEFVEATWEDVPWQEHGLNLLMDSQTPVESIRSPQTKSGSVLLVVGPEGGFSTEELHFLHARPQLEVLTLPTPILRTPTAVATGAGVILQRLLY